VPAVVRKRWGTRTVLAEDHGDYLVLRPVPDDPLAAVRGALTAEMSGGPATDQLRAGARAEEAAIEAMRPDGVPKTSSK